MPREALAGGLGLDNVRAVVDGQVQRIDAGTTISVSVVIGVSARRGVRRPMPRETLAGGIGLDDVRAVIDGQCQGNYAVAAVDGLQRVGIGARSSERLPEEVVALTVPDFRRDRGVIDGVHGQRQGNHAVAAVDRLQRVGVSARGGQCLSEEVVAFAVTNLRRDRRVVCRDLCQGQHDDTVTADDRLQRVGVSARGGQCLSEEVVAFAVTNLRRDRRVVCRDLCQGQHDDTVTADDRLQRVGVGARTSEGLPEEVVTAALANLRRYLGAVNGVHGQHDGDNAVATSSGL